MTFKPHRFHSSLAHTLLSMIEKRLFVVLATVVLFFSSQAVYGERDGTRATWTFQNPLPTGNELRSVWGADAKNVWAVGNDGTIVKWDGATWTKQVSVTTEPLYGVYGTGPNNVWAVGWGGTIVKWDGSTWSTQSSGTTDHLTSIYGVDAKNVWAVGINGTIVKWDGSTWTTQASGTTNHLLGVYGADANVWAVGDKGTILHN